MVRFGKKETTDKRQLLASMDSMHRYGSTKLDNAAFQHVRENLTDLNGRSEANETDLVFLQGILANPAVTQLIKVGVHVFWVVCLEEEGTIRHQMFSRVIE
uniref:L27 domain-containing protein n=1 Tax=Anopheles quadriannulatus TaxID=34691 RepID=A0A182XL98_ANOQN